MFVRSAILGALGAILVSGGPAAGGAAAVPPAPEPAASREPEKRKSPPEAGEGEDRAGILLLDRAKDGAARFPPRRQEDPGAERDPGQEEADREEPHAILIRHAEEVAVTGTAIRETPIDSPNSVAVLSRDTLLRQGSPQLVDLFKNLTASSGVLGEVNSWVTGALNVPETVASVNLRGLGPSRTLVLLNGRRNVYLPAQLAGGRYVDVNSIPVIAVERLDVLKEGAGAIYGSDAIGGVVNFITRSRFEGLEIQASHEYFEGAGDSALSGIWGRHQGGAHFMAAFEYQRRSRLEAGERPFVVRPYPDWWWGWSGVGLPGSFIVPGAGPRDVSGLSAAPRFLDPQCEAFGGHPDNGLRSCRFRYQPWDDLVAPSAHTRGLFEVSGDLGEHGHYRFEGLYADARMNGWRTTPSFGPVSQFDQLQFVGPDHPGRQAFVAAHPNLTDTAGNPLDPTSPEPWYFFGRLVGNTGPARFLDRQSATGRIAASLGGELGDTELHYDLGTVYSRAAGNVNQPAEWAWRKFLAFRGFGGLRCGVGVVVDPASPTRIGLGEIPAGTFPGRGSCFYFNPFSNGLETSAQPGAALEGAANPEYRPELATPPEVVDWVNEEVDIRSVSELFTADATVNGVVNDSLSYAVGYQLRRVSATGRPNDAGNLEINPCPVPGDTGCRIQTGPFTFTPARKPYDAEQTTHAVFTEFALGLGARFDAQVAAHYEKYDFADSWDPKLAVRWSPRDGFAFRGTVQTTFRTPSLDDVNEDPVTFLDWVAASGLWKAIDDSGNADLVPEEAFTYNLGLTAESESAGIEATLDYWSFDFDNPIGTLPHGGLAAAYADPATRAAVASRIVCPGGVADGSCDPVDMERIRVNRINWPGLRTSGLDGHFGIRRAVGLGALVVNLDATWTLDFTVDALEYNGVELHPSEQAAGHFNRTNPLAPALPRLRGQVVASWLRGNFTLTGAGRYISGYRDRETVPAYEDIASWLTFDANLQYRIPAAGMVVTLSGLNLAGAAPPLVNYELAFDGLTHNPKGRRIKLGVSRRF